MGLLLLFEMPDDHTVCDLKDWTALKPLSDCIYVELTDILNKNIAPKINTIVCYSKFDLVKQLEANYVEVRNLCMEDVHQFHEVILPPSFGSTFNEKVTCFRSAEICHHAQVSVPHHCTIKAYFCYLIRIWVCIQNPILVKYKLQCLHAFLNRLWFF
ncbi:hypothetical protein PR048_023512 [Dryococelus australis]|uniref:Uncharacterized protein n=1 Tax=Dryococelus australis TaxID=614101 RepID=A0ABQ9GUD0_9NEOP|nr:hypothetical protein PR048_023512 [Dryococelus australis]